MEAIKKLKKQRKLLLATSTILILLVFIVRLNTKLDKLENQYEVIGKSLIEALNENRVIHKLPVGGIYKSKGGKISYHHINERGMETIYHLN